MNTSSELGEVSEVANVHSTKPTPPALEIQNLTVNLPASAAKRPILDAVSLTVNRGETVGLVGESGSGKSVTNRVVLGITPGGCQVTGNVLVDGEEVLEMGRRRLRALRSGQVAMIFQDPRAGINPVRRIGAFLCESMIASGTRRDAAQARGLELLRAVGINDPDMVFGLYPSQLSGGMLQRVMIAAALAIGPSLLLADEPTTALDVTTQAEVIAILESRRRADAGAAMLFVTHNLELAAAVCDRIYVMYAGRIVEEKTATDLFANPRHPYTRAFLAATPRLEADTRVSAVAGQPLSLSEGVTGCVFEARCPYKKDECEKVIPDLVNAGAGRAACIRLEEIR